MPFPHCLQAGHGELLGLLCYCLLLKKASEQVLFFSGLLSKQRYWPLKLWACNEVQQQSHFCDSTICTFSPWWQWENKPAFEGAPFDGISAEHKAVGPWSKQQPPTSLLPWETLSWQATFRCILVILLTEYLAGSPEMISRYLAFKILYRLWIANRQANGDSAFQAPDLFVPKAVSLLHFPIKFATPGCYSSHRLESWHLYWQNGAICSLCTSRTTKTG